MSKIDRSKTIIDMSKNLTASMAAKIIKQGSLSKHLMKGIDEKNYNFPDLPEYEKLILLAECLELKASKLLKHADKYRNEACSLIFEGENK